MPHCTPPLMPPCATRVSHMISPFFVRVERPDDAGLLPGEQQLAPASRRHQNRGRSEVVVGTASRRARRTFRLRRARRVVHVVRADLLRPDDATGVEVERHHRIARRRRRRRIVVAGRDVEPPPLQIERWRGPDADAGRPAGLDAGRGLARALAARRGIVCVFHATLPSRTRSAMTLPRNVQHGYSGFSARDSSHDDAAMYATPSCDDRRRAQTHGLVLLGPLAPDLFAVSLRRARRTSQ